MPGGEKHFLSFEFGWTRYAGLDTSNPTFTSTSELNKPLRWGAARIPFIMSKTDREKVESLAKKLKEDEAIKIQAQLVYWEQSKKKNNDAADATELRLHGFKKSLEGKLGLQIKRKDDRFLITFGRSPLLQKPRRAFEISCLESRYILTYSIPSEGVRPVGEFLFRIPEKSFRFNSLDTLIEHMTVQAAESINMETDAPPAWAEWGGLIGAVGCWFLAGAMFGNLGFLFGWIPAIIINYTVVYLWPVLIITIIFLIWLAFK